MLECQEYEVGVQRRPLVLMSATTGRLCNSISSPGFLRPLTMTRLQVINHLHTYTQPRVGKVIVKSDSLSNYPDIYANKSVKKAIYICVPLFLLPNAQTLKYTSSYAHPILSSVQIVKP